MPSPATAGAGKYSLESIISVIFKLAELEYIFQKESVRFSAKDQYQLNEAES